MNKPRPGISLALLCMLAAACNLSEPGAPATYEVYCVASALVDTIIVANADPGPATIVLWPDCEYLFTSANNTQTIDGVDIPSALPPITSEITIEGNNAVLTTNLGIGNTGPALGFFLVKEEGFLRTKNLTVRNGIRPLGGAVYIDRARAFFDSTVFYVNTALGDSPSTPAKGGAIYNRGGALTVTGKSEFTANVAYNNFTEPDLDAYGGAIFNSDGSIIITQSTFEENASEFGGAIGSRESAEAQGGIGVIIAGDTFLDNEAIFAGGAIWTEGEKTLFSISGSDFTENTSYSRAGAIHITDSVLDLGSSTFTGNTADDCGAVENAQGSELIVSNTDFIGNSTTGSGGGLCHNGLSLEVNGSSFQSNQATEGWGGGIFIEAPSTSIDNSTFSENTAYKGGGLYAGNLPGGLTRPLISVNIRRSTFYANQAIGSVDEENPWNPAGGGIAFAGDVLKINQSTVWLNLSNKGAGVYAVQGNVKIVNSTISMNEGYRGPGLYLEDSTHLAMDFTTIIDNKPGQGHSSIDLSGSAEIQNSIVKDFYNNGEACRYTGAGPFNIVGQNLAYDESCGFSQTSIFMSVYPLADNGGPTYTHAIGHSSPAYDTGDCHGVTVDQRGESRPKNGGCDLGSFELDYVPDPPLPPDSPTPSPTPSRCEYRAVENANCRASDDARSQLIKVLTKGDAFALLSLNPELTHGLFEIPEGGSCWVWMPLMEGPADPVKNCNVTIVNPPEIPICSADLPKEQCEAAGGTMAGGVTGAPYCSCPAQGFAALSAGGKRSVSCAAAGSPAGSSFATGASPERIFSVLWLP